EHAKRAGRHADVGTAGNDRLLGLAAARRVEALQLEPVAREDAGLGADFGNRAVPQAALADRELEHLGGVCLRTDKHGGERGEQYVDWIEPRAARRNPGTPHSASLHAGYPLTPFPKSLVPFRRRAAASPPALQRTTGCRRRRWRSRIAGSSQGA